eukprot:gnl/TRDRNA2_/TRDRNA2_88660_c0_seq1.p1 gnl/TRDRNA2_/TRDRNA2_88660_c0~~gnl/TRDRNA2_/TRDRNA2_88660_c0_seq1.p1  ORF type:complete len:285 (+),score=42.56 gnl/TRDRNA2_/TRDRNA2_88660_c0_seq1:20-874(+)
MKASVFVIRIFPLFRVVKLRRLNFNVISEVPFAYISIMKCLVVTLLTAHWLTCVWAALVPMQMPSDDTWLDAVASAKLAVGDAKELKREAWVIYLWSYYYAMTLITTVGFGDVTPQTMGECIACTCTMFIGSMLYAYIISSLLEVISNMDPHRAHFEASVDEASAMMVDHHLPDALRHDVRNYFFECEDLWKYQERAKVIDLMSISLQGRVTLALCGEWGSKVPWVQTLVLSKTPGPGFKRWFSAKLPALSPSSSVLCRPSRRRFSHLARYCRSSLFTLSARVP